MQLTKLMACQLLPSLVLIAQHENRNLKVNVEAFQYPPLAASAHIEGDVRFEVSLSGQRPVSGHPLLKLAAQSNLGTWNLPPLEDGKYVVDYHFRILEPVKKQETVLIGDKLDRFFLRLVGAPTKKVINSCYYDRALAPRTRYTVVKDGSGYSINVFVADHERCLNTETSGTVQVSHL